MKKGFDEVEYLDSEDFSLLGVGPQELFSNQVLTIYLTFFSP
jgi:hypothetical protein